MRISCSICSDDVKRSAQIKKVLSTYCSPELEVTELSLNGEKDCISELISHIIIIDIDDQFENVMRLIEKFHHSNPEAFLIVAVDFHYFSFANVSMTLEHVEFLSKPLQKETLQETITREVENIKNRREYILSPGRLKSIINDNIPVIRQHYLSMLMRREITNPETIKSKFSTLQIDCPGPYYTVVIADMPAERDKSDYEAVCFLILNTLKSTIKAEGYQAYLFFDSEFRINCLIGHEGMRQQASIVDIIERIIDYCQLYMDVRLYCGIGEAVDSAAYIHDSYIQANSNLYSTPKGNTGYALQLSVAITQYIEENLGNSEMDLHTISSYFGFSKSYFCRFFRKTQGEGFNAYLQKRRIEWAKQQLSSTDIDISDIARLAGFSSDKYFYTVFHKLEGITPGIYRKKQRKQFKILSRV